LDLPAQAPEDQFRFMNILALEAENLGFDSIWLSDHFHTMPIVRNVSCFECWTTLTALAARTERVGIGQIVTCNSYRNPALLAKMASTLDVISNGRLEFGIGAGWYNTEYKAYGFPVERPSTRIEKLSEAVQIIIKMWTEDRTTFHGKYYNLENAINYPKPIQKPRPRIMIGGSGERLLRVVAQYADQCNLSGSTGNCSIKLQILRKHCGSINRNFDEIEKTLSTDLVIQETSEKVEDFLHGMKEAGIICGAYGDDDKFQPLSIDEYKKSILIGTPSECLEQIMNYHKLGFTSYQFFFPLMDQLESLRLFARRVLPSLR